LDGEVFLVGEGLRWHAEIMFPTDGDVSVFSADCTMIELLGNLVLAEVPDRHLRGKSHGDSEGEHCRKCVFH
jgi:hypothetical protein